MIKITNACSFPSLVPLWGICSTETHVAEESYSLWPWWNWKTDHPPVGSSSSHTTGTKQLQRVGKLSMCCCVQAGNYVDGIQLLVRGQRQDGGKGAANMLSAWRNHPGGKHRGDWGRSRLTELCPLVSEQCEWTTRLIKEIDVFRQPLGCPDPGD